ncbi:MAG: ABC transporter permease [Candidatus Aenigmarchaeota archaeon ex4484_52]|nr:MAG: ABC transporter permease [Candidatus Aenigmarchaeota archaeon ex4484_52]
MIFDFFKLAFSSIMHRKMRAWLTMIGIFIGIAAVVSLISLGDGMRQAINVQFEKMGSDKIMVFPGGDGGAGMKNMMTSVAKLTEDDLKIIRKQSGVDLAGGMIFKTVAVKYKDKTKYSQVSGIPTDDTQDIFEDMETYEMLKGHKLKAGNDKYVILGYDIAYTDYFDKRPKLRDKIYIMDKPFIVSGIFEKIGNHQDDSMFVITYDAANELFGTKDEYSVILVKVKPNIKPADLAQTLKKKLRRARREKEGEESFQVQTTEQLLNKVNSILGVVNAVLIAIASIALLVGGIGIMNTMYTSILERTKDIGIMKAIGAKDSQILSIFLFEAGLYGFIGGAIGVFFGYSISKLAEYITVVVLGQDLLVVEFDAFLIIGSLAFSTILGIISGILPARQAANMEPVEALRYE